MRRRDEQGPRPLVEVRWVESVADLAARFEARYERGAGCDARCSESDLADDLLCLSVAILERLPDDFADVADKDYARDLMILSRIVESLRADGIAFPCQAVSFAGDEDDERA